MVVHQYVVKVVGKHAKDCFAVKNEMTGIWDTRWGPVAWGKYGDPVVTTERRYGKNGRKFSYWLRFICNCAHCKAELHVNTDFILEMARRQSRGMAAAKRAGDR